jgi:hypothetical protein
MRIDLRKLSAVKLVTSVSVSTKRNTKPSTFQQEKNLITKDTTSKEALIMSLFVLSLVQQIVGVSLQQRLEDRQDIKPRSGVYNTKKENND